MDKHAIQNKHLIIPDEIIKQKIYLIRNQKVMLDSDLAALYGTQTKRVKEQVKRNMGRFSGYVFQLTKAEAEFSRSQNATLKQGSNLKYLPYAFTEHGVLMLANVLKNDTAIAVSRRIIEIFIQLRENLIDRAEMKHDIEVIKKTLNNHGMNMEILFRYIDELMEKDQKPAPRRQIDFSINKNKRLT